jgi:methyltransferase (TIGR00027 family)
VLPDAASQTARRVAAHRLRCPRLATTFGRAADDEVLSADVAADVEIHEGRMHRYLCRRTSFFDHVVVDALDADIRQVVLVGAGYDGRAMRFARDGVRFFEVDHPATQADKLARLSRLGLSTTGISFVEVDLTTGVLAERLAAAGLDAAAPSCVLLEGVASYLDEATISSTLRALRALAAPGSTLAVSVGFARRAADPEAAARSAAFREAVAALGEPVRNELSADEFAELLARSGWRRVAANEDLDDGDLASRAGLVVATPVEG